MTIGIDIGGSTTKIVGIRKGRIIQPLTVEANDAIASASGAMGKFLNVNKLLLSDVDSVKVTGVGASFLDDNLLGLKIEKTDEFKAVGYGGLVSLRIKKSDHRKHGYGHGFCKSTRKMHQTPWRYGRGGRHHCRPFKTDDKP